MAYFENNRFQKLLAGWRVSADSPGDFIATLSRNRIALGFDKLTRRYFANFDFKPATVFDIGVHRGTLWLYSAFPDAKLVLIDPMPQNESLSAIFAARPETEYLQKAVGPQKGEVMLHTPTLGNLGKREARTALGVPLDPGKRIAEVESFVAQMIRLDDLVAKYPARPYGLKIDTEGFEYGVIEGASKFLQHCDFVIVETTVKRRFAEQKPVSAFLALMGKQGFEPLECLTPFDRESAATDILFVRADSPLLRNDLLDRP